MATTRGDARDRQDARPADTVNTTTLPRRAFLASAGRVGAGALALSAAGTTWMPAVALAGERRPRAGGPGADRHGAEVLDDWYRTLYDVLMDEPSTTPGRAARIYAYAAVAAYEATVPGSRRLRSLAGQLNGLEPSPELDGGGAPIDWTLAASSAVASATAWLLRTASESNRARLADRHTGHLDARRRAGVDQGTLERSRGHGHRVGEHVARWASTDRAEETFGRDYTPPTGPDKWVSTPPNFGRAIDPFWGEVRTMALPFASFCAPVDPPAPFSTSRGSAFWRQARVVVRESGRLDDRGRETALYWRDNPTTSGLPSGHWMRLVTQLMVEDGASLEAGVEPLALAGVTLHDAFVSCWHEKYVTNLLRPITYIQRHIDPSWTSFVNTPQFPEYTSGHSVASQAAATVLTAQLGVRAFTDRTHLARNAHLGSRSYASFQEAAEEAANSRLIGGIHYPMGIEVGLDQGAHVGRTVLDRVHTRSRR